MIKYLIEYVINKSIIKRVVIEAATFTQAYLLFMRKFPSDYEIKAAEETTGENLPADVEILNKSAVKYTVC